MKTKMYEIDEIIAARIAKHSPISPEGFKKMLRDPKLRNGDVITQQDIRAVFDAMELRDRLSASIALRIFRGASIEAGPYYIESAECYGPDDVRFDKLKIDGFNTDHLMFEKRSRSPKKPKLASAA